MTKLGLCLSGGGTRGVFHIGVLKALDEFNIKPSIISGCSAGALMGCLYAAGVSPATLISLADETKWFNFLKPSLPNRGLIGMEYLEYLLTKYIPYDNFESLNIPCKVIATNLSSGSLRVFNKGELILPIVASCSVPLLFKPILIENEYYLDGGILNNFPAAIIKNDCDVLLGISLLPVQEVLPQEMNTSLKVLTRVLELSANNNSKWQMKLCDILIETPEISSYSKFDLKSSQGLYHLGYQTCLSKIDEIQSLLDKD